MGQCQSSASESATRRETYEGAEDPKEDPLKPIEVLYCMKRSPSRCSSISTLFADEDQLLYKKSDSITASMSQDEESVALCCDRHINWIQVQSNQNAEVQLLELEERLRL